MKHSRAQLNGLLQTWADWKINGGWCYAMPTETAEGLKIRAPGTHSDPTLARMMAIELGGDRAAATVDGFVRGLPRLSRALVNSTYYDPLVDGEPFDLRLILRDYGISTRIYYDQMRSVMDAMAVFLDGMNSSEPITDVEASAILKQIHAELAKEKPNEKRISRLRHRLDEREAQRVRRDR